MKKIVILTLISLTFILSSCGFFDMEKKRVIVLLDLSSSIDAQVYDEYYEKIDYVLSQMSSYDAISVYPIDGGSVTSFQPLMEVDFYNDRSQYEVKGLNSSQTEALTKEAFTKYIHSLMNDLKTKVQTLDRQSVSGNTDIIGALENTNKEILSKSAMYQSQSILVLSDMVQYADNALQMESNTTQEQWLRKCQKIAGWSKGSKIAIVTGSQKNISSQRYTQIQDFWTQYLKSCNAELVCYNSVQNTSLESIF